MIDRLGTCSATLANERVFSLSIEDLERDLEQEAREVIQELQQNTFLQKNLHPQTCLKLDKSLSDCDQ